MTRPPLTVNAPSRRLRKPIPMSSLNATRKRNRLCPSCPSGTPSNDAVSGAGAEADAGPGTVASGALVSRRRGRLLVQIAPDSLGPETPQLRSAGSAMLTSPSVSGRTVISNRSRLPSTRFPPVTRPPVTVNASSRRLR